MGVRVNSVRRDTGVRSVLGFFYPHKAQLKPALREPHVIQFKAQLSFAPMSEASPIYPHFAASSAGKCANTTQRSAVAQDESIQRFRILTRPAPRATATRLHTHLRSGHLSENSCI